MNSHGLTRTDTPTQLLTVDQVAEILQIRATTVRTYHRLGLLRSIRLGGPRGPLRFHPADVQRLTRTRAGQPSTRKAH